MFAQRKPMSFQRMSRLVLMSMVATALLFAALGSLSYAKTRAGEAAWREFHNSQDRDTLLFSQLLAAMGYGGMVHQFKNYVLRGDDLRLDKIQRDGGAALALVDQLLVTHPAEQDQAALENIRSVVLAYLGQIGTAKSLHMLGQSPETIDKSVAVDDGPAIDAIRSFLAEKAHSGDETKVNVLIQLRNTLGYGGLVHEVKNYVLRKDAAREEKIQGLLADARTYVDRYNALATRPEEAEATGALYALLDTLETAVVQVTDMANEGAEAAAIDAQVKWEDAPALAALDKLEMAILADAKIQAAHLTTNLVVNERLALALTALLILVLPFLAFLTHRSLHHSAVLPAKAISDAMTRLAEGDTSVDTSAYVSETEIGRIAAASEAFRAAFIKNEEMSQQAARDAATQGKMAAEASAMMSQQMRLQADVTDKADTIKAEVSSISSAAEDLSRQTEQQAATLESSVAALEELSSSVVGVASSAKEAQSEMDKVSTVTQTCQSLLDEAVSGMDAIVSSSNEVSKETEVIEQIAFQTNLLALNAGVEAARAGEAGRGFAVVATEVLALAQRSAEAASEIKEMIATSNTEIDIGSTRIGKAGESFAEIAGMISAVRDIAEAVAQSTHEQSEGLQSLSTSMNDLDRVAQHNAAMFEETAASTQVLLQNVDELLLASSAAGQQPAETAKAAPRAA